LRHSLRHAYGSELDPLRLSVQPERLRAVIPVVKRALDAFEELLAHALDAARA
jgi:hypothetical protein